MSISDRVREGLSTGSAIRKMFEEGLILRKKYGEENVFDLSLGNPVMEPPPEFYRELRRLAENPIPGMHRYMPNAGLPETREAVAAQISRETGLKFTVNEIVMTCGAGGALNVVMNTILNPGDEVITFAPYFVEYGNYVRGYGGVLKALPTDENFLPRLDILGEALSARTKAVLINSPNNPTGVVYSEEIIRKIGELLGKKEAQFGTTIYLVSDEPYRRIIYDGLEYPPVWYHHAQGIVVHSHSKDLGLAGERIGYIAVHPDCDQREELVNGFIYSNRVLGFTNAPALMQYIVRYLQGVTVPVAEYQKKRDFLYENLVGLGYQVFKPQGAFYLFPRSLIGDDVAFVNELKQWNVLTSPGSGFGGPGHFRISYCVADSVLEGCLAGFRKAARKFNLI